MFQYLARDHPSRRDEVRPLPTLIASSPRHPVPKCHRHTSRDVLALEEPVRPMFAGEIRIRGRDGRNRSKRRRYLDEAFVRIHGETRYLWCDVDHEREVVEVFLTKRQDRRSALVFFKRAMERNSRPSSVRAVWLASYRAPMKVFGNTVLQECGRCLNNRAENVISCFAGERAR